MRFGITPIEVDNIASVILNNKGLRSFLDFRFSDIILEAIEKGYQHCEITLDLFQDSIINNQDYYGETF